MNQTAIGSYIARKRREQNLTQEQLAQQLGVSNKTISKWENGKCMPDYSIIQSALRGAPCVASGIDGRRGCSRGQRARLRR